MFHGEMLLHYPQTARLHDLLFGIYLWLDAHPTETVIVAIHHEGNGGMRDVRNFRFMVCSKSGWPSLISTTPVHGNHLEDARRISP